MPTIIPNLQGLYITVKGGQRFAFAHPTSAGMPAIQSFHVRFKKFLQNTNQHTILLLFSTII